MSKQYLKAKVIGFFNDGDNQYILCNVRDNMFVVKNGDNGYGTLSPSGANSDGFIFFGGFAAIELVRVGGGYDLKRIRDDAGIFRKTFASLSPRIRIARNNPDIITEDEAKKFALLERPYVVIGRSLADSIGFSGEGCSLDINSDMRTLEKAFSLLSDSSIDCESGAVDDIDNMVSGKFKQEFPKNSCPMQP